MYNLITNALKYRAHEHPPLVKVRSEKKGRFLYLTVEDNGLGMDLERDGQKLFGMFKRIHDHVEGSGVGLHLIKKMIENSGGSIEVESKLGKGSVFTVALPLT